jgi:glycosyltransferase involved in cell wall biosynthesis
MSIARPSTGRLRVLQCITRLGLGGAERVAFDLMRGLRSQIDFGVFTVHAASRDAIGVEMRTELVTTNTPWFIGTRWPMKGGGMIPGGLALRAAVRDFRPDIVHFHSETPEACGAVMMRLMSDRERPLALRTIHNSVFWRYWPRIGRWCDRQLRAAWIAGVSEATLTEFQRYRADSGLPPPAVAPTIIYNGATTPIREPRGAPRQDGVRRVLFAGRFELQKGTDVLCQALGLVRLPGNVRGELALLGHGTEQAQAEQLAQRPPPGWSVIVRPPVADLTRVFPDYDLLVMPSRFEGLGLVAIEAMLAGLPVVATDAAGLREVFPPEYPWRATPGDPASLANSLTAALRETAHWREAVCSGQQFARTRFNPAVMAASYQRLYAQMAQTRSPVAG